MSVRLAIVGTGNVARNNYIPYLSRKDSVELGYYNRSPEKANEIALQYPGKVFVDFQELFEWNPESVLVLTSETCRYEIAMELAAGGARRLFFEKPLVAANGQANVSEGDFFKARELLADFYSALSTQSPSNDGNSR